MRSRFFPLVLAAVTALVLAGCSGSASTADPTGTSTRPTQSAPAEPTTLKELEQAIIADGLVDGALFQDSKTGTLMLQLTWLDERSVDEQLDVLSKVNTRIDALPDSRPAQTQTKLSAKRRDGTVVGVIAGYDVDDETLRGMLKAVDDTACSTASLERRNPGDDAGERAILDMTCAVEATDVIGLASGYDAVTSLGPGIAGVETTNWEVSIAGKGSTDALLRLDAGPIAGRQQALVDAMTTVESAGADRITVIDTGASMSIVGFADANQTGLCSRLNEQLSAAGVEWVSSRMQNPDLAPPQWTCSAQP
ncbi:hypothetical protein [Paenarthrobacter nitroguajacolicus]|uniref:hypothetical protein n=1 Tax=Paenarthrobacter nitroguajacolicus TaxID=211146 RepID=UPI004053C69F